VAEEKGQKKKRRELRSCTRKKKSVKREKRPNAFVKRFGDEEGEWGNRRKEGWREKASNSAG